MIEEQSEQITKYKIAIVHDWLVTNAGAEKVLKNIIDIYPNADIFSLVDFLNLEDRNAVICGKFAKTSFIQNLPFSKKHFRKYLFLFPKAIKSFDLSAYDLVISSSWAVAKGIKKEKDQLHISYFQARNMKYIWEEEDLYFTGIKKVIKPFILDYLRQFDLISSKNADYIVSNSNFVQRWVKEKYNRDSTVILPPVDTNNFILSENKENYYITVARLVPYKKIKLIAEAFNEMPNKKLIIVGDGEEYYQIKEIIKPNIEMLGLKNSQELVPLMQKAKAFVYAAIEDFGIVPIEAMSCGTPVVALDDGGTAETVIDGKNGVHFKNQTKEDIIKAVNRFEDMNFDYKDISLSSQKYSEERFKKEFKSFVEDKIQKII